MVVTQGTTYYTTDGSSKNTSAVLTDAGVTSGMVQLSNSYGDLVTVKLIVPRYVSVVCIQWDLTFRICLSL